MRSLLIVAALFLLQESTAQKVRVAVAANAQFVMEKLQAEFERQTTIRLEPIVNSSGKLAAQIQQGAPFDLFLSADMQYPETLYRAGQTEGKPRVYALGLLVLWTRQKSGPSGGLSVLRQAGIRKIAVANPRSAPYGAAAISVLTKAGLLPAVEAKIVYGESIAQVNQYFLSGAVEAAFTTKSVVLEPSVRAKGHWQEVAGAPAVAQGVVLLKGARQGRYGEAKKFYDFLFSATAGAIFQQYGYRRPPVARR